MFARHARLVFDRLSTAALILCASLLLGGQAGAADEETAAKLYRDVNGSVVGLENLEGNGTGFVIDKSGLILTNAHVIASPLPFRCKIDVRRGGKIDTVVFKKVKIVGIHPDKDLALVRIDPKEHNASLQVARIAKGRPSPGQRVYAIGNPAGGDGQVLEKTITAGMLSGVNRKIDNDKVSYYQVDAAINPGNSGGPLFNATGEVLGVVTLKFTNVENTGFAIPLFDLDTTKFVAVRQRRGDPEQAKQLIAEADKLYERARQAERRKPDSTEAKMFYFYSARCYHDALTADPSNDSTYYNVGMLLRRLEKHEVASAYLMQAIELNPWEKERQPGEGLYYRELGLALAYQKKTKEARAVWEEGLAKYPAKGTKLWEDMAVLCANSNDPFGAAYHAQVALQTSTAETRRGEMEKIQREMAAKLDPAQRKKLAADVARIPQELQRRQTESDRSRQAKKEYLTKSFTEFMSNEGQMADRTAEKTPQIVVSNEKPSAPGAEAPADEAAAPAAESVKLIPLPAGAVDLLRKVSVRQDAFKGTWIEDAQGILSPVISCARITFPGKMPEEYDLLLVVERQSNKGAFAVGFVRGGQQSIFYFDAERGTVSGLDPSSRDAHQGAVFTNGKPATIVMKVRKEGLLVSVNGQRICMLKSTDPFPSVPEDWDVRDGSKLFVGADASKYRVYQAAMKAFERKQ